jgi:hypothetical protein
MYQHTRYGAFPLTGFDVPKRDRAPWEQGKQVSLWAREGRLASMRGDRVEIVVDTGSGVRTYEIDATKAGRRVEVSTARGIVEVSEVTRTGQPVRTGRFMAARVVALVEHPAEPSPERGRRRRGSKDQTALL